MEAASAASASSPTSASSQSSSMVSVSLMGCFPFCFDNLAPWVGFWHRIAMVGPISGIFQLRLHANAVFSDSPDVLRVLDSLLAHQATSNSFPEKFQRECSVENAGCVAQRLVSSRT